MYTPARVVLYSGAGGCTPLFQIKSCLCWEISLTLIHGSNEGQLVDVNVIKSTERIFKELLRSFHIYRGLCIPCNARVHDTASCQVQCTISKGVREWLFCSWSGVACCIPALEVQMKKHARKQAVKQTLAHANVVWELIHGLMDG